MCRKADWSGMNWIRPEKRLAIHLRDDLACVYCGRGIEHGAKLTLDHVVPVSRGGKNSEYNLVTACHVCNSRRGDRYVSQFLQRLYRSEARRNEVRARMRRVRDRKLPLAQAKRFLQSRGNYSAALRAAHRAA